jgi:hypothetical protein
MDKAHKPSKSQWYSPLSEPFRAISAGWTFPLDLNMEAVYPNEMLVNLYQGVLCHIIENNILLLISSFFAEFLFSCLEMPDS